MSPGDVYHYSTGSYVSVVFKTCCIRSYEKFILHVIILVFEKYNLDL